mgnify:FL=1|jgi:hypothetical protein|tara:strand:+ start:403 stop:936 length:534 start_codon:yes stop_codon:yes gene_type:complete
MEYNIRVGEQSITLFHENLDGSINVDDLTKIDVGNIYGDAVTISAAVNRIGLIKAEVEALMGETKLSYKIYEGTFKAKLRKQAANNSGFYTVRIGNEDVKIKATEKALETCFETDEKWIELKREFITAEKNFNSLSSLYWACQDKSRKLNTLVNGVTPKEFVSEMIEGKINGILIKK